MPAPNDTTRIPGLFAEAQALPPGERDAFLARACGGDESLRAEIESLLGSRTGATDFLGTPAANVGAELFAYEAANGELPPGHLLGDCRIVSLLGVGGMGEVYLAQDTTLDRPVAIKLVQHGWGGAVLRQFQHERRVLAGLTHPHIARLYGSAVTPEGRAYLVMEYVEGERLDEYCHRRQLGVADCLALFRKVCAAVAYAHQNLVVHRDLKPANIRVTPEGEPKLLDFGIAKLLEAPTASPGAEPTLTLAGAMTPEYASPEQLRGEAITTASDVYSLGVVFYELLGGRRPYRFPSRRPEDMARVICEQEPERLSSVASRAGDEAGPGRRRLSRDLDNIAAMAMRKEPARRYSSVAQFSEDIRRHCAELPVIARKETLPYVAGRFVRRHKPAVAAAVFVALALVGGLVATAWQAHVADQERDRARLAQRQAEQLNDFLQNLLGSADPKKMGKDVKVVQVLDAAGKSIDHDLAGEPEILAQAHTTLSRVYTQLQLVEPAEQHARAALAIEQRLHGNEDPATARAEYLVGFVLNKRFQLAAAEPLLRHALAVQRRQRPLDEYAMARTTQTLGSLLTSINRLGEAAPLLQESLALVRSSRGENDPEYVHGLLLQANLKYAEKNLDGAAADFYRVIELDDRRSPHDIEAFAPAANLCVLLFAQHKFAEMEPLVQRLEQDSRRQLGENNLYYATAVQVHSLLDFGRGEYSDAIPRVRRGLDILVPAYPASNLTIVQGRATLGLCLTRTGHPQEGEPLLRTALADGAKIETWNFDNTFGNLPSALGECLFAQQRYAEAEPLLLSGYDEVKARLGPANFMTAQCSQRLHAFYLAWNKPDRAAAY